MFAWKQEEKLVRKPKMLAKVESAKDGGNRRAIGFLPLPREKQSSAIPQPQLLRYHQLLVSIEGNQNTCCLRIISPKRGARAAILILRGRVLGCLFGSWNLDKQLLGMEAHRHALAELAHIDNTVDAYLLTEEIAIAASALFHGQVMQFPQEASAEEVFEWATDKLMQSNMPGSIAISGENESIVCMVYVHAGQIVGVYSFADGWTESSFQTGLNYVRTTKGAQIMSSMLTVTSIEEVMKLTFSLTGLADRQNLVDLRSTATNMYPPNTPNLAEFSKLIPSSQPAPLTKF